MKPRKTQKKTPPPWVEVQRCEVGVRVSVVHFCLVYEVTEQRGEAYRTRLELGAPLFRYEQPALWHLMDIAATACGALNTQARMLDEKAAKRRTKR